MAFLAVAAVAFVFGAVVAYFVAKAYFDGELSEVVRRTREQVTQDTLRRSSATIKGQVAERFAPLLDGFGYALADARFLGSPIDYVVFDGLTEGEIRGIAFVEVKTGPAAKLTPFQRQVREAVERRRINWRTVNVLE